MRRVILAVAVLPWLALPAGAQSGSRTPTSSGVVSGQGWNTGQDLRSSESMTTAQRRAELQRRAARNRSYPGTPTRTRGLPGPRPSQGGEAAAPANAPPATPAAPPPAR